MPEKVKYTFPREAWPVLRILRRDVARPKTLPEVTAGDSELADGGFLRWNVRLERLLCPMGLHPEATRFTPTDASEFPPASTEAVVRFGARWDTFVDPLAAMDAVWPRKGR